MSVSFVVRYQDGKAREVRLPLSAPVGEIKRYLYEADTRGSQGVAPGKLFLNNKELDDKATIGASGIVKECIVSYVELGDKLTLSTSCETSALPFNVAKQHFLVMVSMKAPLLEDVKRVPIDLVLVIDRSGSMGSLMELVIEMAEFIVRQLQADDRLSIVEYDDQITILLPLTRMTQEGKQTAIENGKLLKARGGTNLAGGLYQGLQVAQQRDAETANEVASVLLFTDGQANEGDTKKEVIVQKMLDTEFIRDFKHVPRRASVQAKPEEKSKEKEKSGRRSVVGKAAKSTVNTFGFGANHNSDLLKGIAEAGAGLYFFIEDRDKIGDAFVECVGGLLSVVGQNLKLEVLPAQGVTIGDILTNYPHKRIEGNGFEVIIKDIQSEENRDLLCQIAVPALQGPARQELVQVKLTYDNVIRSSKDEQKTVATLLRPAPDSEEAKAATVNLDLDKQRNRIISAQALVRATSLGDRGDVTQARKVVQDAIATIQASPTAKDEFCQSLVENLQQCFQGLRDVAQYDAVGSKQCMASSSAHYQQRSNQQAKGYSNIKKKAMASSYAKFKTHEDDDE